MKFVHKLIIILLICVLGLTLRRYTLRERFTNLELKPIPHHIPASAPASFDSTIPRKVFMTWTTRELPPDMYKTITDNAQQNPEFDFFIYTESECSDFISANFDTEVYNAYHSLKPSAYKSDLWRYCVMYIHGGIYLDVKFKCMAPLNDIIKDNKTIFLDDLFEKQVAQGILIANPKESIFLKCIYKIVDNVKTKFYGLNTLHPTGPQFIGELIYENNMQSAITMKGVLIDTPSGQVTRVFFKTDPDKALFEGYETYRAEQRALNALDGTKHYSSMWYERDIYA